MAVTKEIARREAARANNEQHARSLAVTLVDGKHGYTMEFSSSPEQHRYEYDDMERWLKAALDVAGLKLSKA